MNCKICLKPSHLHTVHLFQTLSINIPNVSNSDQNIDSIFKKWLFFSAQLM